MKVPRDVRSSLRPWSRILSGTHLGSPHHAQTGMVSAVTLKGKRIDVSARMSNEVCGCLEAEAVC